MKNKNIENIAQFLEENKIIIDFSRSGDAGSFLFQQMNGNITDIIKVIYNKEAHTINPATSEELENTLKIPNFAYTVILPMSILIICNQGDFYAGDFERIRGVLDGMYRKC